MRFRSIVLVVMCATLAFGGVVPSRVLGQQQQQSAGSSSATQSGATPYQRLEVMRQQLESMRRSLNSAIEGIKTKDNDKKDGEKKDGTNADDPRARLRGLDKEVAALLSDVSNIRGKQERAERYDASDIDKLESAVADLNTRVEAGLRDTLGERRSTGGSDSASSGGKKKRGFLGRILGRGGDDKYDELVSGVAPGRDRVLFEEATAEARKDRYQTARDLYNVIVTTYPDSPFLMLAKLAYADTFYLEGTSSALIQAAAAYKDWLAFFPTHTLADEVMLKLAEVDMRKMGLPDRDVSPARKAEHSLKALLQQFPNTTLKPDVEKRLREVQENLAMHNMMVGDQYFDRYNQGKATNPKGAQSRYREIVEKYPNFSYMDQVLFRLGVTYIAEEEPDEAAKYFQQLIKYHPNSDYAEKAREQLEAIGIAVPEPDPEALKKPKPERPGIREQFVRELLGTTPVTIDKNGVLISADSKANDLIKAAIENGGTLPATVPNATVDRTPPARTFTNSSQPPATSKPSGISVQPSRSGAPASVGDPTRPAGNLPATPLPTGTKP